MAARATVRLQLSDSDPESQRHCEPEGAASAGLAMARASAALKCARQPAGPFPEVEVAASGQRPAPPAGSQSK
jgi:hypothetical protein